MKAKFENDVDELFRLPLNEFTRSRNALASRLKKEGRLNEAEFVKALTKPSISAWAVNQLYWDHRDEFDELISTGERFHRAQSSNVNRKVADMRSALDARREALSSVSDLATSLLQDAGNNPTLDIIRRVTTTLEALSVYSSTPDGPRAGRLTHDVDPPGFDSLASFVPGSASSKRTKATARVTQAHEATGPAATGHKGRKESKDNVRQREEARRAKIAAAKASLQEAKSLLIEARERAQRLEATQKKAHAESKDAEKLRREAEVRLEKAKARSEEATRWAQSVAVEASQATKEVDDAKRAVERASTELEKSFRE